MKGGGGRERRGEEILAADTDVLEPGGDLALDDLILNEHREVRLLHPNVLHLLGVHVSVAPSRTIITCDDVEEREERRGVAIQTKQERERKEKRDKTK